MQLTRVPLSVSAVAVLFFLFAVTLQQEELATEAPIDAEAEEEDKEEEATAAEEETHVPSPGETEEGGATQTTAGVTETTTEATEATEAAETTTEEVLTGRPEPAHTHDPAEDDYPFVKTYDDLKDTKPRDRSSNAHRTLSVAVLGGLMALMLFHDS